MLRSIPVLVAMLAMAPPARAQGAPLVAMFDRVGSMMRTFLAK
jgi:hypothetical protein